MSHHFIVLALGLVALAGLSNAASIIDSPKSAGVNPGLCIALHCSDRAYQCWKDQECYDILMCMQKCQDSQSGTCILDCGLAKISNNEGFQNLMHCMMKNNCIPPTPPDGKCLAEDSDALFLLTDLETVKGDWWVLKGQNCGQDDVWRGGFDWYPCQHGRFEKVDDGSWINNTTFCGGNDSKCLNDKYYVTVPQIYIEADRPGIVVHDYPLGQAPLVPQIEDWKFVSIPHPDWALVVWCGHNPLIQFNGAYIISRQRSLDNIPKEVEEEFRRVAPQFSLDYDKLCVSDNTKCAW